MGAADIIPGVSGGTVALVVGIYERLVGAISRFDFVLLGHLRRMEWRRAAAHIDLRFLVALACGIVIGILALGRIIHTLLEGPTTRGPTLAVFFGAIVASSVLVARVIPTHSQLDRFVSWVLLAGGALFAFLALEALEWTEHGQTGIPSLPYVLICGMIAICAMILPGISGAYFLLVFGIYEYITGIIKRLPEAEVQGNDLMAITVFACGCALGLLMFSKILRRLLAGYRAPMLSVLCGLMIGALRTLWTKSELPAELNRQTILCLAMAIVALVVVLGLDWILRRWSPSSVEDTSRG